MSVVLDIRFWYDTDLPAYERFWQTIQAVSKWPRLVGDWKRLEIIDRTPGNRVLRMSQELSLQEVKDILEEHNTDTLKFSIDVGFQCWRYSENWPQQGFLRVWIESWGQSFTTNQDKRLAGQVALAITRSAPYHTWSETESGDEEKIKVHNHAVEENLENLTGLLKYLIEETDPTSVKIFEDTVDVYYPLYANLVYYRSPKEIVKDVQFLHKQGKLSANRALWVTEETVQVVIEAGEWPIIPVKNGTMILSQPHFMNTSLQNFYDTLLELAEDPAQEKQMKNNDEIATVIASFKHSSKKINYQAVNKIMPIFEQHKDEALKQLSKVFDTSQPADLQWMAAYTLGTLGGDRATRTLVAAAQNLDKYTKEVRKQIIKSLGQLQDVRSVEVLVHAMEEEDREIRAEAVRSLGTMKPEELLARIETVLNDKDSWVRRAAFQFLEKQGDTEVIANLIERDIVEKDKLVCLWGRMGDPRAIEPLLEIFSNGKHTDTVKEAAELLARFQDPRIIPTLVAVLQKNQGMKKEVIEAVEQTLLDLKAQVGNEERTMIEETIASFERKKERDLNALYGIEIKPESPFTFETYKTFIDQVNVLRRKHNSATISRNFEMVQNLTRKILIELPLSYRMRLPEYTLAFCPICGEPVTEAIDTFSLSGLGWWISEPRGFGWFGRHLQTVHETLYPLAYKRFTQPSYETNCVHVQAMYYGVNLNGMIPDDVRQTRYVVIGSEKPGVLRPFMEQKESYAVIHTLPVGRLDDEKWQPRYTVYFVTYFNQKAGIFQRSLLPEKWYNNEFLWPYELMDYDLKTWVKTGKMYWMTKDEGNHCLQSESVETFPYGDIEGLTGRWAVDIDKGALLLPPIQGVDLYNPMQRGFHVVKKEEKQALQRRNFQHS